MSEARLGFGQWVDRIFWAIICYFAFDLNHNVAELNTKMAVVLSQMTVKDRDDSRRDSKLDELEIRLRSIEKVQK